MFYKNRITLWDRALAVIGLWVCLTAFLPLFVSGRNVGEQDSSALFTLVMSSLYFMVGLRVLFRMKAFLFVLRSAPCSMFLSFFALVSAIWSLTPELTCVRGVAIIGTTMFGMYLAITFPPRELLKCISFAFMVTCLGSLGAIYLLPSYGVHPGPVFEGIARGVFTHKNVFGPRMAFIVLYFASLVTQKDWPQKTANYGFLLLSLVLLFLSESREAWGTALGGLMWLALLRSRRSVRWGMGIALTALGIILILFANEILSAVGRDMTFSGRTYIWEESFKYIWERPLVGYGFGSFWASMTGPANRISVALGYDVAHAHCGLVQLLLDLGVIGGILYALALVSALRNLRYFAKDSIERIVFLLFLVYLVLMNVADAALLTQNTIYWLFFVVFSNYGAVLKFQQQPQKGNKYA